MLRAWRFWSASTTICLHSKYTTTIAPCTNCTCLRSCSIFTKQKSTSGLESSNSPIGNMSKPLDPEKIADFLGETRDEAPAEVQHVFLTLEDLWERKLWHQLTEKLLEYYAAPESESQRLPMYNTFILSFADKINQLKLVTLGLSASQQLKGER